MEKGEKKKQAGGIESDFDVRFRGIEPAAVTLKLPLHNQADYLKACTSRRNMTTASSADKRR